ncbi:unnamed protein product [Adineta steineri]|uniref:EGF-like domain-containing protein n=3 Tax=Adineta steineri TaxID=433720 RepID=A0A819IUY7_9BILA|nr:unnamed protein product [Adineta steineri]
MINCQLNLYETDKTVHDNVLYYDCLYNYIIDKKYSYQDLSNVIIDYIPYCFRPLNKTKELFFINNEKLTFEQFYLKNISSFDLLSWSYPIDLIETYELYLNNKNLSNKIISNCTQPWFGLQCQYSFEFTEQMSLNNIILKQFQKKSSYKDLTRDINEIPCYIHLQCYSNGLLLCLDWREICNGYIDCIDNYFDELYCFQMEINQCELNEYRCHNGLCIPQEFIKENNPNYAFCLDRSDEYADLSYQNNCFQQSTFRCEEHSCRTNWHQYPCGDGQCVQKYDKCHNGRHLLLIQSISIQKNLSKKCFMGMICLTKLIQDIYGILCDQIIENINEYLKYCENIFQFPLNPVHFGHIRFLYENINLKTDENYLIIPDYICYDDELCDCFIPDLIYNNLTCLKSTKFDFFSSISGNIWIDIILIIDSHFRSCLNSKEFLNNRNISSLYQCKNSSKLISKDRIIDENLDCCLGDDEDNKNEYSCSINNKYRIKCFNENKCLSSLHTQDDCLLNEKNFEKKILFQNICDGLGELIFQDLKTQQIYTDESQCNYWPCKNLYTRCDGYWTCKNGEDEENCFQTHCPKQTFSCLALFNYSLICLESTKVNDGIIDCLGSMDEMDFCRRVYPSEKKPKRFRCQNSDLCLSIFDLCNNIQSCPQGDDEIFCQNQQFLCQHNSSFNYSLIEKIFCHLNQLETNKIKYFSIHTTLNYPQLETNDTIEWHNEQNLIENIDNMEINSSLSAWSCNRGLIVRIRSTNEYRCMCPPSYYGNVCQYQNERVSLTLGLVQSSRDDVYIILIILINNKTKEIQSYEQLEYIPSQSCEIKYNIYLLYSQRPKNLSTNYSIHIDIYEKHDLTYRASWFLSIPFLFLPVNRISALLFIPSESSSSVSSNCPIKCQHGHCIKYLNNEEEFFCQCLPGWSGYKCNIKINCQHCSFDSLCIGIINNRSICLCPLNKIGPRCLINSSCPKNACQNHAQCIPSNLINKNSSCICSTQYYGSECEYKKAQLDIYLENFHIPYYLIAFFFTLSNQSEPTLTIMIQKLTLFQHIITFHISIPYHIVIIKSNEKYYLAVIQSTPNMYIKTKVNPSRECYPIELLFNSTLMNLSHFQRIKYYHILCELNRNLNCFIDEYYLCLCTKDHHANCFQFNFNKNLYSCSSKLKCLNDGHCLQDHPTCPSTVICVCSNCFYGNQCQFYTKGLGLTLDEILTYEIKSNKNFFQQTLTIQLSALITIIIFLAGLFNSIFSILIFKRNTCQEVGCGIYLLTSSIISLFVIILFNFKFWFLIYSYEKRIRFLNCIIIEPLLKLLLNIDNWLNACVACERAFAVFKGISFQKKQSKYIAKWIIMWIILLNILLLIPFIINLQLFYDKKEERSWCVIFYSKLLNDYNSFILFFHFFSPFLLNLFSALFIIITTAQQKVLVQNNNQFTHSFKNKLKQHKHLLISPCILLILCLPRLIISFTLNCKKSTYHFYFYLAAYFISFLPSICIFIVFVLPSPIYKKEFKQILSSIQRLRVLSNKHS